MALLRKSYFYDATLLLPSRLFYVNGCVCVCVYRFVFCFSFFVFDFISRKSIKGLQKSLAKITREVGLCRMAGYDDFLSSHSALESRGRMTSKAR